MKKIELINSTENNEYTRYVCDVFDIQDVSKTKEVIAYDAESIFSTKWNIGVIYGGSGSGKTTILKDLGLVDDVLIDKNKPLISIFDWLNPKDASSLLMSVGLSSVPVWLRPLKLLSNGERYRAELAYRIGKAKNGEMILIDEYTSVVDRNVAKAMSYSLQKYIRKTNKQIILSSCHSDIMDWLMPDWTCSPQNGGALERGDYLRQGKPKIELQVSRTESDTWNLFKKHHYLTEERNKGFGHLIFEWKNNPVGILIYKNQPSQNVKNGFGISRVVVSPDYQGLGIGSKICEFFGGIIKDINGRCFIKTIHPALGEYFNKSKNWRGTSKNGKLRKDINGSDKRYRNLLARKSYCHEYIGEKIAGYDTLLKPIREMRLIQN
jgi:ABC-type lipoprotein export system ATPase subunit